MKLIKYPNKLLRKKSRKVPLPLDKSTENLIQDMIAHVNESQKPESTLKPAVGISAIQFGIPKKIFYINLNKEDFESFRDVCINPEIVAEGVQGGCLAGGEGCLSVDGEYEGLVHRKNIIVFRYWSYFKKEWVEVKKMGYLAIIIQHELDHLNGKLFIDRINQKNKWAKLENEILI